MTAPFLKAVPFLLAMAVAGSSPAWSADPLEGRRIAERWCSSCHVAADRGPGTDAVPTLQRIAADPSRDPGWLRQWLNDPHPPMPDLHLSHTEIENVVAYLQTLAR